MKKFTMLMFFVLAMTGVVSAQNQWPDLKAYFAAANELKSPAWDFSKNYFWGNDSADSARFSNLTGDLQHIDSYLEFALLTYYSAAEKPWAERGNAILPLNNPRLVDRQLGAAVFQEIQVLRFLGNTAAVGRHEGILKFITDRGNVTRAEVESFYRANIGAYIAAEVDAQIPKSYYGAPRPNVVTEIKQIITNFYLNPTQANFDVLAQKRRTYTLSDGDYGYAAGDVLIHSVSALSLKLGDAVADPSRLAAVR